MPISVASSSSAGAQTGVRAAKPGTTDSKTAAVSTDGSAEPAATKSDTGMAPVEGIQAATDQHSPGHTDLPGADATAPAAADAATAGAGAASTLVTDATVLPAVLGAASLAALGSAVATATSSVATNTGAEEDDDATPVTASTAVTDLSAAASLLGGTSRTGTAGATTFTAAPAPAAPPTPTEQVAQTVLNMATVGGNLTKSLSIVLAPDKLGSVGVTVQRAADGTLAVHVTADRLETLHLLQSDQSDLKASLNQAGLTQGGDSSLTFSWSGSEGGSSAWANQSQGDGYSPNRGSFATNAYNDDQPVVIGRAVTAAGSIDITA
jgi:hypothetical protein